MEDIKNLHDIIKVIYNCDDITLDSSSGSQMIIPVYEISPADFLEFAEDGLEGNSKKDKINTVSNLKRAIDCQIDIFLESINLGKVFKKNNLKFEQKTKFLADVGILSSRSINKLNSIRNKLEHEYKIPTIDDLHVYYELVWHVTEIMDARLLSIRTNGEISYTLYIDEKTLYLSIIYDIEKCEFRFEVSDWSVKESDGKNFKIIVVPLMNKCDLENYIIAFKAYLASIHFFNDDDLQKYKNSIKKITPIN